MISVPFQNNFEYNLGPLGGTRYVTNIQPVIPISINKKWNLISRTIVSVISQNDVSSMDSAETGIGDINQSIFFSPKEAQNGIVWGFGTILTLPTATNDAFGLDKWGAGPSAIVLKLKGQWTYGALTNHVWSYAGSGTNDINASFFQPFVTYATKTGASLTLVAENTKDWNNSLFGGFAGLFYAQVTSLGKQRVQFTVGPKFYYGNNPFNPEWGFRANITLLFPN